MTQELDPSLDALVAPGQPVDIAGERWTITPLVTEQFPAFLRAIRPVMDELQGGDIMAALMLEANSVIEAIAIASGKPRTWVNTLRIDDLVKLGTVCMEVNGDFFVQKVLPVVLVSIERVRGVLTGFTLPLDSSPTATATAT